MERITISHEHPLVYNEDEKALGDHEVLCNGCRKPISGPSISCTQCQVFVHKACAELPLEMEHPMHSQHRLFLLVSSPYGIELGLPACNACFEFWKGFVYHCYECNFDLDIICAFEERKIVLPSHHHPLLLLQRKIVSKCDACSFEEADCCYICMTCQYCIHKNCANLPSTISVAEHACGHPLPLVYSLLGLINFYFNCDFCYKTVSKELWSYFCSKCKFVAHLKCAISAAESLRHASVKDIPKIEAEADPNPNLLCLPVTTNLDLIKYFITKNHYETNLWSCRDPGHHDLSLYSEQPKAANGSKTLKLTCEACALPITSSFYCCTPHAIEIPHIRSSCNYFLHEVCSRLSREIQHPYHPQHPLFLYRRESFYGLYMCDGCNRWTNGFVYGCASCNFILDVKCASLPATILHEAHKHTLVQGHTSSNFLCRACGQYHSGFRFACETCENYSVAFRCVQWERFTSHRWDEHPLPLICSTRIEHPAEFICEICEYEIHPQFWFYHCIKCDNSFHPYCMPQYEYNIKFGGVLRHEKHPHPLAFRHRSKIRHTVECKCCGLKLKGTPIFECIQGCDLGICQLCIVNELWK